MKILGEMYPIDCHCTCGMDQAVHCRGAHILLTLREFLGGAMSLVVKLEDDLGEQTDWVILHGVLPSREERSFPCLRGIDLYGKTVFNHLQMEGFLEEWDRVRERARDDSQMEAWQKVKEMGEKCRADRDLYLRFVGN